MDKESGVIELWKECYKSFLIIKDEAGETYSNQTGGYACNHPSIAGYLIPFPEELIKEKMDDDGWWSGDAEEFLEKNPELRRHFDGNGKSEEAWINLKLKGSNTEVVLTYCNSD